MKFNNRKPQALSVSRRMICKKRERRENQLKWMHISGVCVVFLQNDAYDDDDDIALWQ
jgi:hypothetical protein